LFKRFFGRRHTADNCQLPKHIAIIMDGNGRWARRRGLPRKAGHAVGSENFRTIATFCRDIGIEYLTVYALSTENRLLRPEDEVTQIFDLLRRYLNESLQTMERDRVRFKFLGDLAPLPEDIRALIGQIEEGSKRFTGCQVNLCVNYGARDEILRAVMGLPRETVTEADLQAALDTSGIPDPDLCIRTGGECRLSNFLLWQLAYAELFFTKTLWPDFSKRELTGIFKAFSEKNRRYGGL